jgi:hypothetical protein
LSLTRLVSLLSFVVIRWRISSLWCWNHTSTGLSSGLFKYYTLLAGIRTGALTYLYDEGKTPYQSIAGSCQWKDLNLDMPKVKRIRFLQFHSSFKVEHTKIYLCYYNFDRKKLSTFESIPPPLRSTRG